MDEIDKQVQRGFDRDAVALATTVLLTTMTDFQMKESK